MASVGKTVKKKSTRKKPASKTSTTTVQKSAKQASSKQDSTTKVTGSKKKSVVKKAASKKPVNTQTQTRARTGAGIPTLQKIDPEHRRRMIAETSYFIAERRGFVSGSPTDDWLEAEVLVDRLLESGEGKDGTSSVSPK